MPDIYKLIKENGSGSDPSDINKFFNKTESISIDYAVMERSDRVVTVPCSIGWSDIGTWQSLYNLAKNNVITLEPQIEKVMLEQLEI